MPYLPDLIPGDRKVIPEYFHKQLVGKQQPKADAVSIILGLLFSLIAIWFIRYVGFAALFGLLALSCTNGGKRWLEKVGRFSFSGTARIALCGLVILLSLPVYLGYAQQDEVDASARVLSQQKAAQFTADSLRADEGRKKELYAMLGQAAQLEPDSGLKVLTQAEGLVKTAAEKDSAQVIYSELQFTQVKNTLEHKNYRAALAGVQKLLAIDHKPEFYFYRARCYVGIDSTQLAVNDLDSARAMSYKPAAKLYERVNPEKRRVTGYCTLCADGSISYATGRGACSWHGGVAEWNHPIYETYRKY